MARALVRKGFTLIELLVVIAIIALLISILLPSLQGAREQGKKAVCLANLRQIAQGAHSYANDDETEMIVPIMWMKVRKEHQFGFGKQWSWRTALPFAYGGRTPQKPFPDISSPEILMDKTAWNWGAPRRPLNRYLYGAIDQSDFKKMPLYHCPADTGYPVFDPDDWGGEGELDAPPASAGIPCYDFLGNSYRINTCGLVFVPGGLGSPFAAATLSVGAEGHKATAIDNPSRTVLFPEPLFYFWSRQDPSFTPEIEKLMFPGWHKKVMSDNVSYCDGSARTTRVESLAEFLDKDLEAMGVTTDFEWFTFLRRGKTWQTDSYRAPGAVTVVYDYLTGKAAMDVSFPQYTGWPFDGYTVNQPPK
jgi:prepilin-type N-terminal cleavage/methylation domain-containing protein